MNTTTLVKSAQIAGVQLHQVRLQPLNEHKDYRGSFTEIFQENWGTVLKPVQWSLVKSEANVFRGMHFHQRHDEYFCLIEGHCILGLRDLRPGSPTQHQSALFELFGEDPAALIFPLGMIHGWYFHTPSIHIQSVSEAYIDYGPDDNWRCRWDDPELELPWGIENPILTDLAATAPSLRTLIAALESKGHM
jgi:dTDP-4-dehydrorhamnose 3,5-epimerase